MWNAYLSLVFLYVTMMEDICSPLLPHYLLVILRSLSVEVAPISCHQWLQPLRVWMKNLDLSSHVADSIQNVNMIGKY